jgi:hypothetical protein
VLWLIGIHGQVQHWLRPVQFIGGIAIGVMVARRGGRHAWFGAPLAALAFRVLTDPFVWGNYGMGPVLFAVLWDATRPGRWTRWPVYSVATLLVEGLLPWLSIAPGFRSLPGWGTTSSVAKLVWGLGVIAAVLVEAGGATEGLRTGRVGWYARRRKAAVL